MGEAPDEAQARAMIEGRRRASVTFHERTGRYRWAVIPDHGKSSHGWADTRQEAWWFVGEALNRTYRGTRYVGPRCRWERPPD